MNTTRRRDRRVGRNLWRRRNRKGDQEAWRNRGAARGLWTQRHCKPNRRIEGYGASTSSFQKPELWVVLFQHPVMLALRTCRAWSFVTSVGESRRRLSLCQEVVCRSWGMTRKQSIWSFPLLLLGLINFLRSFISSVKSLLLMWWMTGARHLRCFGKARRPREPWCSIGSTCDSSLHLGG